MAFSVEHLRLPQGDHLDILLIGMSGDGKSSTGNSILNRQRFEARGGLQSITRSATSDDIDAKIDGRILTVVDTPGFSDTRAVSDSERVDIVAEAITHSLVQCPLGFDAIVLVISYGRRLDDRVRDILKWWMYMIGDGVFQTHGVVALTYGDNFVEEQGDSVTVQQWWENQCVSDKWFWDQCGQRCVLFQNKTKDFVVRRQQLYDLVTAIDGMGTRERVIPSICWLHGVDGAITRSARDECWKIRNFDKYFSLLRQSLEHLTSEYEGSNRGDLMEQLKNDISRMKLDLMKPDNKFVYNSIEEQFSQVFEKLNELQTSADNHEPVIRAMIDSIMQIHESLCKLITTTKYWNYVKHEVKTVVPGIMGVIGFAVAAPVVGPGYGWMIGSYLYAIAKKIKQKFS